jgi:DHA1 family tetracycline resistance protein-like MFS transporter
MALPQASAPPPRARTAALGFIFVSTAMSAVSMGLIFPILPNLIRSFFGSADAPATARAAEWLFVFGAAWGAMQFVSGPVLGMLSDRFGRRPVMLVSILGLSLDLLVMTFAPSLAWLLLGRAFSGLTSASFSAASAYVADISPPDERAKNFGWISAGLSLGFLVGPAAGGLLAGQAISIGSFSLDPLRTPFLVSAILCMANGVYGLLVLPESLPPERRMKAMDWAQANPAGGASLLASHRDLLPLAGINFLCQLALQVLPNIFVLYVTLRHHWSLGFLGMTFAAIGVVQILVQSFVVGPVVARIGERGALIAGVGAVIVGFLIFGLSSSGAAFFVAMPIFELGALIQPGLQGLMTRRVSSAEQGRLQGINQSIGGVAAILGPALFPLSFAWALRHLPGLPGLPILVAAGLLAVALGLAAGVLRTPGGSPQN